MAGHAGAKAALFGLTGVLLDRYGSVDEHGLHGRALKLKLSGALFVLGGLALAGLPPFGTGLGKAVTEEAAGRELAWLPIVFVLVSALTGGAVLRAGLRVFGGVGAPPSEHPEVAATTGEGEEPEIREPGRRLPAPMLVVPGLLLTGCLAVGVLPGVGRALASGAAAFIDRTGYLRDVLDRPGPPSAAAAPDAWWTASGTGLGLLSALLAAGFATAAVRRDPRRGTGGLYRATVLPLRRLHSGLLGDYVAWLAVGLAALLVAVTTQL
ncbi:hypothetical protein ACIRYZ_44545 [Kitasatospora sp. NPDC101155]|uniref:hypothetical protein n=1 Tax=Kitasatospora sp. NPDC101155 TaxID=3364097 RepID=UPI003808B11E